METNETMTQVQEYRPHKTFFIERGDGEVFAMTEEQAHETLRNRTNWMRRDFKLIGVSDGQTHYRIIRESKEKKRDLREKIAELQKVLTRYINTEEKLRFEDVVDDNDPKLKRVVEKIKEIEAELDKLQEELKGWSQDIAKKAFNAELEAARGNIEMPGNFNVMTPNATQRDKQIIHKYLG